jgi:hypothetical protein
VLVCDGAGDSKDPLNTRANPANLVSPLDEEAEEDSDEDSSAEEGEEEDDGKKKTKKKSQVQKYRPPKMAAEKFEDSSGTLHTHRTHHRTRDCHHLLTCRFFHV